MPIVRIARVPVRAACAAVLALALACATGSARAQVLDPIIYGLTNGSTFEYGCFDPCACPVRFSGPVSGTFTFYRTSIDPLFTHYALLNIDWIYTQPEGASGLPRVHHIRGAGTFDYGGEVAISERMTLDLSFDGEPAHRFESGLVPARVPLPAIDIDVHSNLVGCVDSLLRVVAKPGNVGAAPGPGTRLLSAPVPDPAPGDVQFVLSLSGTSPVRVDVIDVSGRVVATLLDGRFEPGARTIRWDGRDTRGVTLGAGVYWVRARAGSHADLRRFVRLGS